MLTIDNSHSQATGFPLTEYGAHPDRDEDDFSFRYTQDQLYRIIGAYQNLFETHTDSDAEILNEYFDFARHRQWSILTTNFNLPADELINKIILFDNKYRECRPKYATMSNCYDMGESLKRIAHKYGVGYSLGICPKTDDLLEKTFDAKKDIVIVLGHDWYPIVTADHKYLPYPPLTGESVFEKTRNYNTYGKSLFPQELLNKHVVLYLNLLPDYREPGADNTGSWGKKQLYSCFQSFLNIIKVLEGNGKKIKGIISWGKDVYSTVRDYAFNDNDKIKYRCEIINAVTQHHGEGILILNDITYYPYAHPCFPTNFKPQIASYQQTLRKIIYGQGRF